MSEQEPVERGAAEAGAGSEAAGSEAEWVKKRRLAEIFGDVLPETTRDERDERSEGADRAQRGDDWLRSQVPPHHGG